MISLKQALDEKIRRQSQSYFYQLTIVQLSAQLDENLHWHTDGIRRALVRLDDRLSSALNEETNLNTKSEDF